MNVVITRPIINYTIQRTNQNPKQTRTADEKRGKMCASELHSTIGLGLTSDDDNVALVFVGQSRSVTPNANKLKQV